MKRLFLICLLVLAACSDADHKKAVIYRHANLTKQEVAFINEHGVFSFATACGGKYLLTNNDGKIVGATRDYLDLITARSGVRFQIVCVQDYEAAMDLLDDDKVDMMGSAKQNTLLLYVNEKYPLIRSVMTKAQNTVSAEESRAIQTAWDNKEPK